MLPPHDLQQPIGQRRHQRAEALGEGFCRFRELIGKLGSGERTSTGLTQAEAREAIERILAGQVSPAQAGAFLIAHRLRRPRPEEMAGMLEAYHELGPTLPVIDRDVVSFGVPFDGRCREAPLLPLTALVLISAGLGVVLQGGAPMPVKYGVTNAELLAALDLPIAELDWPAMVRHFHCHGLALLHQPHHFPAAEQLVPIREQIGKRPPIATLELLWSCYRASALQVSGFVHAPTEDLAGAIWPLLGQAEGLTVKGLEGSTDLPTSRVAVAGHWRSPSTEPERLLLQARDYDLRAPESTLGSLAQWRNEALAALRCEGPLAKGLIWNAGFYLWRQGSSLTLEAGLAKAESLLQDGSCESKRRAMACTSP
jgi:anthranilate phosphoribosyltransferase